MRKPIPIRPEPGQESVWDYPRPPRVEKTLKHFKVEYGGAVVAESHRVLRVLETASAPVYYFPPEDVDLTLLQTQAQQSFCEWKGLANYVDVVVGDQRAAAAAWAYAEPTPGFASIRGYLAFYAQKMDACYVDGERARPQPGRFYGGWVTDDIVGPIKGEPGTGHW